MQILEFLTRGNASMWFWSVVLGKSRGVGGEPLHQCHVARGRGSSVREFFYVPFSPSHLCPFFLHQCHVARGRGSSVCEFFYVPFSPHICVLFFRETAACLSHLWVCSCEVVDFTGEIMCNCRSTSVCACEIVDCICEFVCIILSLTSVNFFFSREIVAYICEFSV